MQYAEYAQQVNIQVTHNIYMYYVRQHSRMSIYNYLIKLTQWKM